MQKILFNNKYNLTLAVQEGRKTKTRRLVPPIPPISVNGILEPVETMYMEGDKLVVRAKDGTTMYAPANCQPRYKIGEIVAVAQAYREIPNLEPQDLILSKDQYVPACTTPGWTNKELVRADLMSIRIRITGINVERLQEISDEDCIREGIATCNCKTYFNGYAYDWYYDQDGDILATRWFKTPRKAFAALAEKIFPKINGIPCWDANPWIYAYEFEIVR